MFASPAVLSSELTVKAAVADKANDAIQMDFLKYKFRRYWSSGIECLSVYKALVSCHKTTKHSNPRMWRIWKP